MGPLFFIGRLVLVLGLYGMAFAVGRSLWRCAVRTDSPGALPIRQVRLSLRKAVGAVQAGGIPWTEGGLVDLPLPVTFGRRLGNSVQIEDPFISSCHAEMTTDGSFVWLVDRGSKNGTWNGKKKLDRPVRVEPGGEFRMGGTVIGFEE